MNVRINLNYRRIMLIDSNPTLLGVSIGSVIPGEVINATKFPVYAVNIMRLILNFLSTFLTFVNLF